MREHISRKKTTTGFSIPSLKQPTRGFGLESSAISRQAPPEIQPLHKPLTHDISRIPLRSPQAQLSISQPGDKYEQEADSVAQQVMQRMAHVNRQSIQRVALPEDESELQMKSLDNSTLQRQEAPEDESELQMKPMAQRVADGGMTASPELETSIQQAKGGGQALSDRIKSPMEQAFGADFSGVRVHTDSQADQLNKSIQAKAFTTGQDVFFRQGAYAPGSRGGQELIAHELTHVVQQGREKALQRALAENLTKDQTKVGIVGERHNEIEKSDERQIWSPLGVNVYYESEGIPIRMGGNESIIHPDPKIYRVLGLEVKIRKVTLDGGVLDTAGKTQEKVKSQLIFFKELVWSLGRDLEGVNTDLTTLKSVTELNTDQARILIEDAHIICVQELVPKLNLWLDEKNSESDKLEALSEVRKGLEKLYAQLADLKKLINPDRKEPYEDQEIIGARSDQMWERVKILVEHGASKTIYKVGNEHILDMRRIVNKELENGGSVSKDVELRDSVDYEKDDLPEAKTLSASATVKK